MECKELHHTNTFKIKFPPYPIWKNLYIVTTFFKYRMVELAMIFRKGKSKHINLTIKYNIRHHKVKCISQ